MENANEKIDNLGKQKETSQEAGQLFFSIVHSERLQRGAICTHRLQYNHNNNCKNKTIGLEKVRPKFKKSF